MFSTFPSSSQRPVVYYFPISIWVLGVVIEIGQDKDRERLWPGRHLRLRSPLFYRLGHTARRPRVLKKLRQWNDHERVPLESDTSPMSVSQIRDPSLKSNCRYSHTWKADGQSQETVCFMGGFNSETISLGQQYGRRDVMWKPWTTVYNEKNRLNTQRFVDRKSFSCISELKKIEG